MSHVNGQEADHPTGEHSSLSAAEFRLLAENASDLVFRSDVHLVLQWVSPSVRSVLGYDATDLIGTSSRELVHPDDQQAMAHAAQSTAAGQPVTYRARFRRSDGHWKWLEITVRPLLDEHGELIGRIGSGRDVDDEQAALQALRESEARYRLLAENSSDIVATGNNHGTLTWISDSVTEDLGWAPHEVVDRPFAALVHQDDHGAVRAVQQDLLDGRERRLTARIRCKDGGYRWYSILVRPQFDDNGTVIGRVAGWRDVDAEVRARQTADAEAARRVAMLDSMLDPHVLMQAIRDDTGEIIDFVYTDANEAACTYNHLTREQLVGTRLMELLPGHRGSDLFASYCHTINTGEPLVLDDYVYPHDILAEPRHYDIRGVKVGDALSFTWRDVTDRSAAEQALAESEERFRLIATNTSNIIAQGNTQGILEWVSPSVTTLGWLPEQWIGHRMEEFIHPDDLPDVQQRRLEVLAGKDLVVRARIRDASGVYHWAESRGATLKDDTGTIRGITATIAIIDERVAWEAALEHQANHDRLTGLLTREEAYRRLTDMLSHAPRTGIRTFLAFTDLDNMKSVNDELGHAAGDELLRIVAHRIRTLLRDGDPIARLGGDEMMLILPGVQDESAAVSLANRLLEVVGEPHTFGEHTLHPRMSIGLVEVHPGDDVEEAVRRADRAMYEAKAAGGNQLRTAR